MITTTISRETTLSRRLIVQVLCIHCALMLSVLRPPTVDAGMTLVAPAAPPPSNFAHLARSPAAAQLAAEFFARESRRPPAAQQQQPQQQQQLGKLSSDEPHWSSADANFRLDQYHPLEEIYAFVDGLAARHANVQVFSIGRTEEGRPIKALEIINNASDSDYVWLDALTHAREWITGSTLLYTVDQLVAGAPARHHQKNRAGWLQRQAPAYATKNYIIVPVANPDGYAYTWTTNRMWRKNRSTSAAGKRQATRSPAPSTCLGADLNRNYEHPSFGGEGASQDPCSHIYSGPFPFSERETRSMADLMWSLRDRIKFYLTIHSYNQLWACPYAHSTEPTASYQEHMRVLRTIQSAVEREDGVRYEIGPLSTSLYVGSGFGIDFAYDKCKIQHSYLVELRDKGAHGFILPPDQIMPTARETFAGLAAGLAAVFR